MDSLGRPCLICFVVSARVEPFQEVLYGLEQFDDNIQIGTNALEGLR